MNPAPPARNPRAVSEAFPLAEAGFSTPHGAGVQSPVRAGRWGDCPKREVHGGRRRLDELKPLFHATLVEVERLLH